MPVLRKFILYSVGLHLLLVLTLYLLPRFSSLLPEKPHKVTWVKLTKGVDEKPAVTPYKKINDMPFWTIREQKEALSKKSVQAKDKKTIDNKKKKAESTASQKKAEAEGATQFTEKKPKRESTIDQALARMEQQMKQREIALEAPQVPEDGGGQSPDGSLDTNPSDVSAQIAAYGMEIKRRINREWITTPKEVPEGQILMTRISLEIDSDGQIVAVEYAARSGDATFDASAKRAVERASPFPAPPGEIKTEVLREGFLIEFNPRSVVGRF